MTAGITAGVLILCLIMFAIGGAAGWAITYAYYQNKREKASMKFLRKKMTAANYIRLLEYDELLDDDYLSRIIFIKDNLKKQDFDEYVKIAGIKTIK